MKQRLSTIMTLAVLIVGGTTSAQAGELISGTTAGGQLAFYSDAACTSIISKAASGSTVYIRAIPDYGYTGIGATLSALATVGSGQAEARSAVKKPDLPFGEAIDVTTVDDARGIYRLTMPNNTNVTVSGTLATATATTVSYVDENNETQTVSAVPLDQTMTALAADQWYVVASDLTFTSGFTGTGNMCMVVPDGVTLTVGTEASPLQGDAFNGGGLCLYGQENATGKLSVNSTGNGIYLNNVYAIANLDINITCNASAIYSSFGSSSSSVIAGHSVKGNKVTLRAGSNAIYAGGHSLIVKRCDIDAVGSEGNGVYASGGNLTIEGLADGSNDLTVRSRSTAIGAGGGSAVIKYCDIDAVSTNSNGIEGNYSSSTGMGVHIEGIADGSNNVTLRCAGYGINGGGCSVTVKYCDVEVTGATQNEAGQYGFCGYSGIIEGAGSGMNIIGCASGNMVVVRSNSSGINGAGCSVNIQNCSVDVVAKGEYGISSSSGTGLTITGLADGSSDVTVRCLNNGINAGGLPVTILNCDVEVTGLENEAGGYGYCNGAGIYATGSSGITITGVATGNRVTVRNRSSSSASLEGGGRPVTIKNCTLDLANLGGKGINANGRDDNNAGVYIEGLADGTSSVTVRSATDGIYAGGQPVTIKNCPVDVVAKGEYGIFATSGTGITIEGLADGSSDVTVRSNGAGCIYGSGCAVAISNCDLDLTCTGGYGIFANSGNGLSLTSTLEEGNKAKVVTKNNAINNHGNSLTISNYTVEITGEGYGIYDTRPLNIINSDITVESANSGLYATGSASTITDSRVKVTTTGTKQDDEDLNCYDAILIPYGLTISGSQLEASAQEGNWGINLDPTYGAGTATFSWTHATDYLNVSSCNGPVKVADGQMLTDGSSLYSGELTADEVTAIGGKTLRPGVGVAFAPAGYATYYAGSYDLVLPEGVQAFAVTDKGAVEGTLTYVTVADGDTDQNIVPAGTAVMLKVAATDVEQTLPVVIGSGADAYSGSNLLSGSDTDTEILTATGYAFYKLAYGPDNTTFGWYWGAEDGQPFTSPAHKAWLTLPASVDARFLGLPEGEATAIAAAAQERVGKDGAWYTIGGVKLDGQPTAKGIYIKDGKKVVIK